MTPEEELRSIVDANRYMTLGTVCDDGRPWVTPVYFAHVGYTEFIWVSRPDATHSRNIAARPAVSIVVFDSTVAVGHAQAVFMVEARAEELAADELEGAVEVLSRRLVGHDAPAWPVDDVREPSAFRLYRATAAGHSVLRPNSERLPVALSR